VRTLAELENTLATTWSIRDWRTYLFAPGGYPRRRRWQFALRLAGLLFRKWTALPGDRFSDFQRDITWVVTGGRPGHLQGVAVSGQMIQRFGWDAVEGLLDDEVRKPIPRHVL
jgi:hypothetical protein